MGTACGRECGRRCEPSSSAWGSSHGQAIWSWWSQVRQQEDRHPRWGDVRQPRRGPPLGASVHAAACREISELRRQVDYVLVPAVKYSDASRVKQAIRYVADFVYVEKGVEVIEDVKGVLTPNSSSSAT